MGGTLSYIGGGISGGGQKRVKSRVFKGFKGFWVIFGVILDHFKGYFKGFGVILDHFNTNIHSKLSFRVHVVQFHILKLYLPCAV